MPTNPTILASFSLPSSWTSPYFLSSGWPLALCTLELTLSFSFMTVGHQVIISPIFLTYFSPLAASLRKNKTNTANSSPLTLLQQCFLPPLFFQMSRNNSHLQFQFSIDSVSTGVSVNGLNTAIKRPGLVDFKNMTQLHAVYKKLTWNVIIWVQLKGWNKIHWANNQKKAGVVILISNKVDFRAQRLPETKRDIM